MYRKTTLLRKIAVTAFCVLDHDACHEREYSRNWAGCEPDVVVRSSDGRLGLVCDDVTLYLRRRPPTAENNIFSDVGVRPESLSVFFLK
ncbi:hypothetical protein Tco_0574923 [Tanacetum coccineum]